jgi:DNA-binding NarL/FixJ family response regulator
LGVLLSGPTLEPLIRVFLLIENRLLREALGRLCRKRPDLQVVGAGGRNDLQLGQFQEQQCDVLVFDFLDHKWLSGKWVTKEQSSSNARILLVGMEDDEDRFLEAVKAGASGYLLKDASASDVIAGIRASFRGEAVCPSKLCSALFDWVGRLSRGETIQSTPHPKLTIRQQQLVGLVARGLTNKEIAARLNLSEFTVRNHIHRILKLVDAGTRREAVDIVRRRHQMQEAASAELHV